MDDTAKLLKTVAENEQKVYEAGKQSEYDRFWDSYQDNGTRTVYNSAFAARSWNEENFKPKYDLICTACNRMFENIMIEDIEQALKNAGVAFDTSQATYMENIMTYNYKCKVFPALSFESKTNTIENVFYMSTVLETVRKFILKNDGSQTFRNVFYRCDSLKNIVIEGVIGNDFDIQYSPLSRASIESIVSALSDTVTGKTVYFKATAKTAAFTNSEWSALIATKPNWTFSLV